MTPANTPATPLHTANQPATDSRYAWLRLMVTLVLMTIGSSTMYIIAVVLPAVQAELGVARAAA